MNTTASKMSGPSGALLAALTIAATGLAGTGAALAQDVTPQQDCRCIVPAGSTGQVLASSGNVQVSGRDGFSVPEPGMDLLPGSRIIVGARSDAQIVFGGCRLNVTALRDISADPVAGGICLRETAIGGRADVTTLGTESGTYAKAAGPAAAGAAKRRIPVAAIVAGVAVVGAVSAIALSSDSEPASD